MDNTTQPVQERTPREVAFDHLLTQAVLGEIPHGPTTAELEALTDAELTKTYVELMRAETVPARYRARPTAQSRTWHAIRVSELKRIRLIAAQRAVNIDAAWRADCEPEIREAAA